MGLLLNLLYRSYLGWTRVAGGRGGYAIALILAAWMAFFVGSAFLFLSAAYRVEEYIVSGQMSAEYPPEQGCAFVTLVTGGPYVRGARVLAHTLRKHTKKQWPLVAMSVGLSRQQKHSLEQVGWQVEEVEPIPFRPVDAPREWDWIPEKTLGAAHVNALTKMHVWEMTQYPRIVFIDADIWAVGDVSDLCRRQEDIAAMGPSPFASSFDINSGVMSLAPSKELFKGMMKWWRDHPRKLLRYPAPPPQLRFPDQSLIITYVLAHPEVKVGGLSQRYNLNARKQSWSDVRLIHFNVDAVKPWRYDAKTAGRYRKEMEEERDWGSAYVWGVVEDWLAIEKVVNKTYGTFGLGPKDSQSVPKHVKSSQREELLELQASLEKNQ